MYSILSFIIGLGIGLIIAIIINSRWKKNAYSRTILNKFFKVVDLRNKYSMDSFHELLTYKMAKYHPSKHYDYKTIMNNSLYLDDIRPCPPGFTYYCRTVEDAIEIIKTTRIDFISFDHDLGYEKTGYDLAKEIEFLVYENKIKCPDWTVHSANPVGIMNINRAMTSATMIERKEMKRV